MFTSSITCFFGISGIFPMLCSTKWSFVRIYLYVNEVFKEFYSSVGIVCMVNPDADNIASEHTNNSVAIQRNIPASCHQHTMKKSRSV
jgi:hypothetical protein